MTPFRRVAVLALPFIAALATAHAATPSGPLEPRNECTTIRGLAELDAGLRKAAKDRDTAALLALVDDNIELDFGGGSGKAELTQRLTSPDYRLWDALDDTLKLGCGKTIFEEGEAFASWPWYFHKDLGQRDPYETLIVTGRGVRLRSGPSLDSRIIGAVSWDYVFITEYPKEDDTFAKVTTKSGQSGYMAVQYLRSEVDYRLVATERDGKWVVTAFIAGD